MGWYVVKIIQSKLFGLYVFDFSNQTSIKNQKGEKYIDSYKSLIITGYLKGIIWGWPLYNNKWDYYHTNTLPHARCDIRSILNGL